MMEALPIKHFNTTLKRLGLCSRLPWLVYEACRKGRTWHQLLLILGKPNPKPGINIFCYIVSKALVLTILWWATKVQAALNFLHIFLFIQRFLKLCAWGRHCIFKRTYKFTWICFQNPYLVAYIQVWNRKKLFRFSIFRRWYPPIFRLLFTVSVLCC